MFSQFERKNLISLFEKKKENGKVHYCSVVAVIKNSPIQLTKDDYSRRINQFCGRNRPEDTEKQNLN